MGALRFQTKFILLNLLTKIVGYMGYGYLYYTITSIIISGLSRISNFIDFRILRVYILTSGCSKLLGHENIGKIMKFEVVIWIVLVLSPMALFCSYLRCVVIPSQYTWHLKFRFISTCSLKLPFRIFMTNLISYHQCVEFLTHYTLLKRGAVQAHY